MYNKSRVFSNHYLRQQNETKISPFIAAAFVIDFDSTFISCKDNVDVESLERIGLAGNFVRNE